MSKPERSGAERSPDGRFLNPEPTSPKSVWKFLATRARTEWARWPSWVDAPPAAKPPGRVEGDRVVVTVINHATALIQADGKNVLTDPIFSMRCSPVSFAGPRRVCDPAIAFDDVPRIDLVLLSHDHYDHLDRPTLDRLIARDRPLIMTGLGVTSRFPSHARAIELDWWQSHAIDERTRASFVPTQHFSGRSPWDQNRTLWGAFVLEIGARKVYFGGDSGYGHHYRKTFESFGAMDAALLPIGAYAPRDFMGPVHMNPEEAVRAHLDLRSSLSIGIHYGTFHLTAEPIDEPLARLRSALAEARLPKDRFVVPPFGTPIQIEGIPNHRAQPGTARLFY